MCGAKAIADMLRYPTSKITSLNMAGNQIGIQGVTAICKAIVENPSSKLMSLNIGDTGINPDDIPTIATFIANPRLNITALNMCNNHCLGDKMLLAISEALCKNPHSKLTALDVSGNGTCDGNVIATFIKDPNLKITSLMSQCDRSSVAAIAEAMITHPLSKVISLTLKNYSLHINNESDVLLRIACWMRKFVFNRAIDCPQYDDCTPKEFFKNCKNDLSVHAIQETLESYLQKMPAILRKQCIENENYQTMMDCLREKSVEQKFRRCGPSF